MKRKKNEEYRESQITTINIFGFTFNIKNHSLCVAGYLKRGNDTSKLDPMIFDPKYKEIGIIQFVSKLTIFLNL